MTSIIDKIKENGSLNFSKAVANVATSYFYGKAYNVLNFCSDPLAYSVGELAIDIIASIADLYSPVYDPDVQLTESYIKEYKSSKKAIKSCVRVIFMFIKISAVSARVLLPMAGVGILGMTAIKSLIPMREFLTPSEQEALTPSEIKLTAVTNITLFGSVGIACLIASKIFKQPQFFKFGIAIATAGTVYVLFGLAAKIIGGPDLKKKHPYLHIICKLGRAVIATKTFRYVYLQNTLARVI